MPCILFSALLICFHPETQCEWLVLFLLKCQKYPFLWAGIKISSCFPSTVCSEMLFSPWQCSCLAMESSGNSISALVETLSSLKLHRDSLRGSGASDLKLCPRHCPHSWICWPWCSPWIHSWPGKAISVFTLAREHCRMTLSQLCVFHSVDESFVSLRLFYQPRSFFFYLHSAHSVLVALLYSRYACHADMFVLPPADV